VRRAAKQKRSSFKQKRSSFLHLFHPKSRADDAATAHAFQHCGGIVPLHGSAAAIIAGYHRRVGQYHCALRQLRDNAGTFSVPTSGRYRDADRLS
jgi:hypothetical protein